MTTAFVLELEFPTLSNDVLASVQGGITRDQAVSFGGQAAEVGALAGGAAIGTALGGPGGAAAGVVGAEVLNRTGASSAVGGWVGGKVYDGAAAVGRGAQSAWNAGKGMLGY